MWRWLKRLAALLCKNLQEGVTVDERLLELEREVQTLRLELQERERIVANLKSELERQRRHESARITEVVQTQMEQLLTDAAAPVAQLLTQAHLLEMEGKPVQAKDVLAIAKRLVRILEDRGLTLEGNVGKRVPFDPNRHEPLNSEASIKPGESVVIKFVGVSYQGKIVKKAGVVKEES